MEREVHYCTTDDGVRIAYCVEGRGRPIIICPQLLESFSAHHVFPSFDSFQRQLGSGRQAVWFDFRGTGLSQRDVDDVSLAASALDIDAVADAVGLDKFGLIAFTAAGPSAIYYAAHYPSRVRALVLYGTYPSVADLWSREFVEAWTKLAREEWDMAARAISTLSGEEAPDEAIMHARMLQRSITGEMMSKMFLVHVDSDTTPLLDQLEMPTLVAHRLDDAAIPFKNAEKLAAAIPSARLLPLPGKVNNPAGGDSQALIYAIDDFLGDRPARTAATAIGEDATTLRAVLFTDIVGHAEMMSRLGDEQGRDMLRGHERITREVLGAHGGTEVKTMGDGFMASFGSVTRAVECAIDLQNAFAKRNADSDEPLNVRAGINAGEPIGEDGDLFGTTVILASRLAARADGGEILVANTVRELCAGKSFRFADRGEFVAKGFEEPMHVYEVKWRSE